MGLSSVMQEVFHVPPRHSRSGVAVAFLLGLLSPIAIPALGQSCSVSNMSGSYGTLNVLSGSAVNSSSTFTINCSGTANSTVRLCIEVGIGNPPCNVLQGGQRAMCDGGSNYLLHEFYSNAARTQIWGSWGTAFPAYGSGGVTYDLSLGGSGSASRNFTVYSRVFGSQQTAVPGSYQWPTGSPAVTYGYAGGAGCPTGGSTSWGSGGTLWTASIPASCIVGSASMSFGTASSIPANVDSNATLSVTCTNTTPYNVGLGAGSGSGATVSSRKMTSAGSTISYSLYANSGRSVIWGETVGSDTVAGTGTGGQQTRTIYGRVPAQATPPPGTYSDNVVITVTY